MKFERDERDIEYLDKKFPKGKTKFRGQTMVLLALARIEGERKEQQRILKLIDEIDWNELVDYKQLKESEMTILRKFVKKIKQKCKEKRK